MSWHLPIDEKKRPVEEAPFRSSLDLWYKGFPKCKLCRLLELGFDYTKIFEKTRQAGTFCVVSVS